ncbi:hypothetical protein L6164_001601 [Bauhinia variegata]|uniref:Uncharacterized protein n=1 Tax=Bauhinia variegata TaxID=167791 RepID=A0ACB9QA24_BAUVA|nr:hypothetical protein L6164_001601 [Bauhinia variegata]
MEAVWQRFQECDVSDKTAIKNKLREIASLTTLAICPPVEKVKRKSIMEGNEVKFIKSLKRDHSDIESSDSSHESLNDSTSSSSHSSIEETKRRKVPLMLEHFPQEIHEYIEDVIDVTADGNCGYRAIATLLGKGEESWAQVRLDLIKEIKTWHADYVQIFGSKERVQELVNSLYVDNLSFAPCDKWMTIPDMGYVIASRYNVVLVYLSISGSMTFLPLRGPPVSPSNQRLISIGFLPNSHFVPVFLKEGSPIPPVALQWRHFCSADAREWETPYTARMQVFKSLFPCEEKEHVTSQV